MVEILAKDNLDVLNDRFVAIGELRFEGAFVAVEVVAREVYGGGDVEVMKEVSDMEKDRVAILVGLAGVSIIYWELEGVVLL